MSMRLSVTSYAVLSLLGVQPWSTYALARQMDRSLGRIWPRAESKIYEEPKKLVALGLARARDESNGGRQRTVYSITPKGRRALAAWLSMPGEGPVLECEALVKIGFAEFGTRDDALATLAAMRAWAEERNADNVRAAGEYAAGEGPFQQRVAQNMLVGGFLTEFYRMVAEWSDRAAAQVEQWPDDLRQARPDEGAMAEVVRRANW